MGRFIIHKNEAGVTYVLKDADGKVLLASDLYSSDNACRKGIASVTKNARSANFEDLTQLGKKKKIKHPKYEIYQDEQKQLRVRLKATNGQIIGIGNKAYASKDECLECIQAIRENAPDALVDEE